MTDLRTLLHASAPTPQSPLDMAEISRRARRRSSRRLMTWLGVAGLTLGLGIPGGSILVTADNRHHEHAGPSPTLPLTEVTVGASIESTTTARPIGTVAGRPVPDAGTGGAAVPSGTPAGRRGGTATADEEPHTTAAPPPTSTTVPSESDPYPLAASCAVDNAGLRPSEQRRCRFTATTAGGASRRPYGDEVHSPQGQVLVTRDGATTAHPVVGVQAFAGDVKRGCEELFIEPGDRVEVILTNSATGTQSIETIGAGEHWECYGDQ